MKRMPLVAVVTAITISGIHSPAAAQTSGKPTLHDHGRWEECAIQLSANLTQNAWRQFTQEAGLVTYFRPLVDARPIGKGRFDLSIVQWETAIDDADAAWNDTFVHPDSTHYLFEGDGQKFPGLMARAGISDRTDVALYVTKNPLSNYGFVGAQVQRNLAGGRDRKWNAAVRASLMTLFGPEDVDHAVGGIDLVVSRTFTLKRWAQVSPYTGVSAYLTHSHEKSDVVSLRDETVGGGQAMVGVAVQLAALRIGMEYNAAEVRSKSLKLGFSL